MIKDILMLMFLTLLLMLFPYFIGFWEHFGSYPKLVKNSKKLFWPIVAGITILLFLFIFQTIAWRSDETFLDVIQLTLISSAVISVEIYIFYRLGRRGAKEYEQKEKEKELEKELHINPEAESKYFSWENIDVPVQEYTMDMAFERIVQDILQSTMILKNNEDIARHKKQVDLVDKIFLSAQKSLVDGEPRLLNGMGDDTIRVLAMMEGTPFFFSLLPERKGPDGTVHRRGQIQVGDSKSYSITVIYELGLQTDDPAQWWKYKEPKQSFALTTRKKQECKEE